MLKLYNSLTRKLESFKPISPTTVGVYACGPTVYDFAHIGNFRTYNTSDLLVRVLKYNNYDVDYVMNLTDVGHLTGDNLGDADLGDDRMEKTAAKEGRSAWEVAKFYTDAFFKDYELLGLTKPKRFVRATDHIREQIELIQRLEEKGFTYIITDGIYFDTSQFEDYGALSDLDKIEQGARIQINKDKKNKRDFALWKFSPSASSGQGKRQMEWDSPWGVGFPGWHLECSAMSMKYLGETFDIHTGGVDLKSTHHPNEIAQSEAATGKKFVNYWIHGAFILVAGERMSKSLGNNYKLYDLQKEGYDPLALRYLYLQTHYRKELNFTFASLDAAQTALKKLWQDVSSWEDPAESDRPLEKDFKDYEEVFMEAVNDDLNMSKALGVMWELVKSDNPTGAKSRLLFKMDEILGLDIKNRSFEIKKEEGVVPEHIKEMLREREKLRREKRFNLADLARKKIEKLGYIVEDGKKGARVRKA